MEQVARLADSPTARRDLSPELSQESLDSVRSGPSARNFWRATSTHRAERARGNSHRKRGKGRERAGAELTAAAGRDLGADAAPRRRRATFKSAAI